MLLDSSLPVTVGGQVYKEKARERKSGKWRENHVFILFKNEFNRIHVYIQ